MAFDSIDHMILPDRFKHCHEIALKQTFSVGSGNCRSFPVERALQGSPLGPFLFSCNMLPLGRLTQRHNLTFNSYADDTAVSSDPRNRATVETLSS